MPNNIYTVEGNTYEFPDTMSPEQVQSILISQGIIKTQTPQSRRTPEGQPIPGVPSDPSIYLPQAQQMRPVNLPGYTAKKVLSIGANIVSEAGPPALGAIAGAKLGTAIGTAIAPGPGTVTGGAIGLAGGALGGMVGEWIKDPIRRGVQWMGEKLGYDLGYRPIEQGEAIRNIIIAGLGGAMEAAPLMAAIRYPLAAANKGLKGQVAELPKKLPKKPRTHEEVTRWKTTEEARMKAEKAELKRRYEQELEAAKSEARVRERIAIERGKTAQEEALERIRLAQEKATAEEAEMVRKVQDKLKTTRRNLRYNKPWMKKQEGLNRAEEADMLSDNFGPEIGPEEWAKVNMEAKQSAYSSIVSRRKVAYSKFDAVSEKAGAVIDNMPIIKQAAKVIEEIHKTARPVPQILQDIVNSPSKVSLKSAEENLSVVKRFTKTYLNRTDPTAEQRFVKTVQEPLDDLIRSQTRKIGGEDALKSLESGRALARLQHDMFNRGAGKKVATLIQNELQDPLKIVQKPETLLKKYRQVFKEAGLEEEGEQLLRRRLFEDAHKAAFNPHTKEWNPAAWSEYWGKKVPKSVKESFTDEQLEIIEGLGAENTTYSQAVRAAEETIDTLTDTLARIRAEGAERLKSIKAAGSRELRDVRRANRGRVGEAKDIGEAVLTDIRSRYGKEIAEKEAELESRKIAIASQAAKYRSSIKHREKVKQAAAAAAAYGATGYAIYSTLRSIFSTTAAK